MAIVAKSCGNANQWFRLGFAYKAQCLWGRSTAKGRCVDQALVEDRAEGPNVGAPPNILRVATPLLWRHVGRRAHDDARSRQSTVSDLGQSKVSDLRFVEKSKQDICRFKIAMNDAPIMGRLNAARNRPRPREPPPRA